MQVGREQSAPIGDRVATVILAGGEGTRLFPLTVSRCKPAVCFGGHYRLIDIPISNSLNSRMRRIYIISQYFASGLHQHILSTYHLDQFQPGGFELISPEDTGQSKRWFKGTADAVRQSLDHLLAAPVDYYLILSGDQLYTIDFREMLRFAMKENADLTIATIPVKETEARRMGLLKTDAASHVTSFFEKPSDPDILKKFAFSDSTHPNHYLGSMGIYIFKRSALVALLQEKGDDFGKDLIPLQIKKGKTSSYLYRGYWEDIGTIGSYYTANLALTEQKGCLNVYDSSNPIYTYPYHLPSTMIRNTMIKQSLISEGAIIDAKEITHSIVGVRIQISEGTIVRDSIIMGNHSYDPLLHQHPPLPPKFSIGKNCVIERAIIDESVLIGDNVKLVNKQKLDKYDGNGVYIRDGIIIVPTGAHLPDGFEL